MSGDDEMRCAECDCENGGSDCNWIKTPPARATPKVKPLVWELTDNGYRSKNSDFPYVLEWTGRSYIAFRGPRDNRVGDGAGNLLCGDLDIMRDAVQADLDRRILSALETETDK